MVTLRCAVRWDGTRLGFGMDGGGVPYQSSVHALIFPNEPVISHCPKISLHQDTEQERALTTCSQPINVELIGARRATRNYGACWRCSHRSCGSGCILMYSPSVTEPYSAYTSMASNCCVRPAHWLPILPICPRSPPSSMPTYPGLRYLNNASDHYYREATKGEHKTSKRDPNASEQHLGT